MFQPFYRLYFLTLKVVLFRARVIIHATFSEYDKFSVCVGLSLDKCHGTVAAEYQGVDAMFEYLCGDGRVGKS